MSMGGGVSGIWGWFGDGIPDTYLQPHLLFSIDFIFARSLTYTRKYDGTFFGYTLLSSGRMMMGHFRQTVSLFFSLPAMTIAFHLLASDWWYLGLGWDI